MSEGSEREQEFTCSACRRTFTALPSDVKRAGGHLCIAADRGLSQREGLAEIEREHGLKEE